MSQPTCNRSDSKREAGSALFIAMLMLALMGFLGIAALNTVGRDREVAGLQSRSRTAFYAAEAAVADAREIVASNAVDDRNDTPAFPDVLVPTTLGDNLLYDRELNQLPRYYGDPDIPFPPIRHMGKDKPASDGFNFRVGNQQQLYETFWVINVVGESPNGGRARVEAVAIKLMGKES